MTAESPGKVGTLTAGRRYWLRAFLLIAVSLLVLSASCALAVFLAFPDWASRASFGDMFGAVNALLSSLALAGVVVTVLLQSEELGLQRQVLRDSARLSALAILIPILRKRAGETPEKLRASAGYEGLIERLDSLEDELDALASGGSS